MIKYINREIEETVTNAVNTFSALVVTGPRQSGKTTLLKHLFSEKYDYVSFDDPLLREKALTDPELFLSDIGYKTILDEIQYVPGLLSYLKMEIDSDRSEYGRFLLTGSQQFHLTKNIGDTLAGRIAILNLLPLRITEIMPSTGTDYPWDTKKTFLQACLRGLYPEIALNQSIDSSLWYSSYIQTYLERDVRGMANIGNLNLFQRFIRLLASRCAQILNMNSLSKEIGVSANTIKNWISILQASQIIFLLPPFYNNLGKRIVKSPKIYFLDIGLVTYLTGIQTESHLLNGPMGGALFENFVVQEVIKTFYNRGKRANIYYLRTNNQLEIDLLVDLGHKIIPIEIKLTKTLHPGMAKQIENARKQFTDTGLDKGIFVSLSDKETHLSKDTMGLPLNRLLKQINSNL